ncbi:MAG TPA: hypothetical protein VJZ76_23590 [Thermoanaerobaculia bacterium]|nr:hypothetical protein [Thermoanaerobaculia bacterium]
MVRKQFYIDQQHEEKLKRIAQERGVTEAEVIRQAIEGIGTPPAASQRLPDPEAFQKLIASMRAAGRRRPKSGPRERWTRESLYEERISRWTKS